MICLTYRAVLALFLALSITGCTDTTTRTDPAPPPPTSPTSPIIAAEPTSDSRSTPTSDSRSTPTSVPESTPPPSADRLTIPAEATMIRAVDGDTIAVDPKGPGAEDRIRVLGINTPERGKCAFREATQFVTDNIPAGTRILLVSDETQSDVDGRGRFLRYVRIPQPDGSPDLDLSIASAEAGWAEHYNQYPVSLSAEIKAAEARAQAARLGRWGLCQP